MLSTLLYLRGGFPIFGDAMFESAPAWERLLTTLHAPGVTLLTLGGLCCGYASDLVIGDVFINGRALMSPVGPLILGIVNVAFWITAVYAATLLVRRARGIMRTGAA